MALTELQAQKLLELGMSPRAKRIDRHQRYVDGTVYDGRPDFFDAASDATLDQRKPYIVYPAARNAIVALSGMCLGDGRFPTISSGKSEDDSAFDSRFGLSDDDSKVLDAGIGKIVEQTDLESVSRDVLERAMAGGSVAVLASVVRGELRLFAMDAKCCEPEFAKDDPDTVVRITESYRYRTEERNPNTGHLEPHIWQYRRVIDDEADTTYQPVEILRETEFPVPSAVKTRIKHGFGFCPVIWYGFRRSSATTSDFDGTPIHEGLLSLIDAVNISLSQRHRAARYCGDPQLIETGVEDDDMRIPTATVVSQPDPNSPVYKLPSKVSGPMRVRKKGAGTVWRYVSPDAKAELLTLPGDALKCLVEDGEDNIKRLRESLGFVYIAPEDVTGSGDISGKTLLVSRLPEVQTCNRIRSEYWRKLLLPLVGMLLRIVLKVDKGLYLAGADKIRKIAARFESEVESVTGADGKPTGKRTLWFNPDVTPTWGDYFEPSDQDESTRITNAATAREKKLITKATAVEHIRPIFSDIKDTAAYVEALDQEAQEDQAKLHAAMAALNGGDPNDPNAGATPPQGDGSKGGDGGGGGGSDPASGKGGAATPAAAAPAAKAAASPPAKAAAAKPAAKPAAPAQAAKAGAPPARKPAKQKVTGKSSLTTPAGKLMTVGADGATHELFGPTDHMRATDESPGIAEKVYRDLTEDYDEKQLEWVKHASWRGPLVVPLEQIDWTKQQDWPATEDQDHIQDFVERIESDGYVKPIILVNEPNNDKLVIADGHHRALAYKKLGQNPMAYVASVGGVMQNGGDADWRVMHDSQRGGSDQIKR